MKTTSLHIAFAALLSLLLLASCSRNDEVAVAEGEEGKVYVTLTLSINGEEVGSRATWNSEQDTDEEGVGWENKIDDLQILIYDDADEYVGTVEDLFASNSQYVGTLSGTNWQSGTYKFVVLANFTASNTRLADLASIHYNQNAGYIPMWGVLKSQFTFAAGERTNISIDLLRAMAKVEVNFAESFPSDYEIGAITISPYNTQGYCVPAGYALVETTGELDREEAGTAYSFNPLASVSTSSLTFTGENGKYYIYLPEYDNSTDAAKIQVTVNGETYELEFKDYENGAPKDGTQYDIVRNHIYRYTITGVNDGKLIIKYKAMPWELVESKIGYAPQPASTEDNPFDTENEYNEFLKNGYILLPMDEFKEDENKEKDDPDRYRRNVQELFRYLYDYPGDHGDDDARYCVLTRPTYVDEKHRILKTGSAGARYFFMLTGPEGATWQAHLLDENGKESDDFEFSYTKEDDFDGSEYESDGEVRKVSHGIARKKPYIIQVICKHSWTGTDENAKTDADGVATGNYPWEGDTWTDEEEDRVYDINHFDDWSESAQTALIDKYNPPKYFSYETAWGKSHKESETHVQVKLYITVTTAEGATYNLEINPSYENNENKDKMGFLYKAYRRYAGDKDFVWIRQVPAQYEWGYEDLANPNKNEHQDQTYWWQVNDYWK